MSTPPEPQRPSLLPNMLPSSGGGCSTTGAASGSGGGGAAATPSLTLASPAASKLSSSMATSTRYSPMTRLGSPSAFFRPSSSQIASSQNRSTMPSAWVTSRIVL